MNTDMISYYKERATEYEKIYSKPERQSDLLQATQLLQNIFAGKEVFEIACGTGYWTERISVTAKSVLATDINEPVLEIARSKSYSTTVDFRVADIFNLTDAGKHESLFGGFIWSHIPLQGLPDFIAITNNLVQSGGTVVFMDNNYVAGSNLPVTDTDEQGNTYQTRRLEDGTVHKVLKNFPAETFISELLTSKAKEIDIITLKYYWILKYKSI